MLERKREEAFLAIPKKANTVLQVLSFLLFCICLRLVYLTVQEHTRKEREEQTRTQKIVYEAPLRGTIQDRFGITLARNQVSYQVSIVWSDIVEHVPRWGAKTGHSVARERFLLRKQYITALSRMLAKELSLDPQRIEDIIYSYAVFSHCVPVPLKRELTEEEFYRLNAKSRLWPGLVLERTARRVYPEGATGCQVVGYTAPLSKGEYDSIISEMHALRTYMKRKEVGEEADLPPGISSYFHAKERLKKLESCGYGFVDSIGKTGIEAAFDEQLRGARGYKKYVTNSRGDILLSSCISNRAISGKRIKLTLSSELQEYCERLLLMTEKARQEWWKEKQDMNGQRQLPPFIRGGAIVAIDPQTSEVLALASTPRYDPNEIHRKSEKSFLMNAKANKPISWFRNEPLSEAIWDGMMPLSREQTTDRLEAYEEAIFLSWDQFLRLLFVHRPHIVRLLDQDKPVAEFLDQQKALFALSQSWGIPPAQVIEKVVSNEWHASDEQGAYYVELLRKAVGSETANSATLLFDVGRLLLRQERLSPRLEKALSGYQFQEIDRLSKTKAYLVRLFEEEAFVEFQKGPFQTWRQAHERTFLQQKRQEEEHVKKPGQPYLLYLDKECTRQFHIWWKGSSLLLTKALAGLLPVQRLSKPLTLILAQSLRRFHHEASLKTKQECFLFFHAMKEMAQCRLEDEFFDALQSYKELGFPLFSAYRIGGSLEQVRTGKGLVSSLLMLSPPPTLSFAFSQVSPPGSIFKLVTAYAAMEQYAMQNKDKAKVSPSLFLFHDEVFRNGGKVYVGYDSSGKPIPQVYKGGRIPKSLNYHIGPVDMVGAIASSSNPYFALLSEEKLARPNDLLYAASSLGYGEKSGLSLPNEAKGRVPLDLTEDKTGLYTTAIGQHTLLATPLQSAMMLSTLTTDGTLFSPRLIKMAMGRDSKSKNGFASFSRFPEKDLLHLIGIDFPLFLEKRVVRSPYRVYIPKSKKRRKVRLDPSVREILLQGMAAAVSKIKETGHSLKHDFRHAPSILKAFMENRAMIGKSSTAESLEIIGLNVGEPPFMYSHTAFGAVFFEEEELLRYKKPSLVVVVFLRYGKFGKQAAPIAAAVKQEWERIKKHHQASLSSEH